jgi:hypothetical protein
MLSSIVIAISLYCNIPNYERNCRIKLMLCTSNKIKEHSISDEIRQSKGLQECIEKYNKEVL